MSARCEVCGDVLPTDELLTHFRLIHPDIDMTFESWPDGAPVIVDQTLEPGDFI